MDKNNVIIATLAVLIVISLIQAIHISSIDTPTAAATAETESKTQNTPVHQAPQAVDQGQLPFETKQAGHGCGL